VLPQNRLPGLCPACTWSDLFEDAELSNPPTPTSYPAPLTQQTAQSTATIRLPIRGYEVLEVIARGGMGIVYRAHQLQPDRLVALKMLLPHQVASPAAADRFRVEIRALTELDHPNILPVYEVGEYEGIPFFTMKLAPGGTLSAQRQSLSGKWRQIAELMIVLADAVHFAHERGVLHRDLKPGNILFDENRRPYISDFGLAKLAHADGSLTQSTDFLGSPHYLAPELATQSARHATISSDLYSLGAILFELLAGQPPFQAENIPALLKKIVEEEPAFPHAGIPADLQTIALKCLNKNPATRYRSARELSEELSRWLNGEPITARPISSTERLSRWARRNPALASLSSALFVTLLAGTILLWKANRNLVHALNDARHAEAAAEKNLGAEMLSEARAQRASGYGGDPKATLGLLARLAKIDPSLAARNEAVAVLAAGAGQQPIYHEFTTTTPGARNGCTLDVSPQDDLLLTGSNDGVALFDTASRQEIWRARAAGIPWMYVFFHPDGKSLLYSAKMIGINQSSFTRSASNRVEVTEPTLLGRRFDSTLHAIEGSGHNWLIGLDRDPLYIVRADVWPDGRPESAHTIASGLRMTAIALSPDGRWAASTTVPGTDLQLWDAQKGVALRLLGIDKAILPRFSPDGRFLVARSSSDFSLLEVGTWKKVHGWPIEKASRAFSRIAFSPDGQMLLVPQSPTRFQLLDATQYHELLSFSVPAELYDAVWSHDAHKLYMLSGTGRVLEWDLAALHTELAAIGLDFRPGDGSRTIKTARATLPQSAGNSP